jgi:hypothetical protein
VFIDLKEKEGSQLMKKQFCYYAFCDEKAQYHGSVIVRHGNLTKQINVLQPLKIGALLT